MIKFRSTVAFQEGYFSAYEFLFTMIFIFNATFFTLDATQFAPKIPKFYLLLKLLKLASIALLPLILLLKSKINTKSILFAFAVTGITLIVAMIVNGALNLILLAMLMICGYAVKTDKLLKCYLIVISFILFSCFLFWKLGIFRTEYSNIFGEGKHYYIGFTFFSYFPNHFLNLVLVYFSLKKKPITVIETAVILLLNHYIYKLCLTTAPYGLMYIAILLLWGLRLVPKIYETKLFCWGTVLSPVISAIAIVLLSALYSPKSPFMVKLNDALSDRLSLGHTAIERYGLPIMGSDVEWVVGAGTSRSIFFYVDSSYLNAIITYGLIFTAIMILGFSLMGKTMFKEKKYVICIILIIMAVHGFSDPQLFSLKYNPFLVYIGAAYASTLRIPALRITKNNSINMLKKVLGAK